MTLPGFVAEAIVEGTVPAEIYTPVPSAVGGVFPFFLNIAESKKFTSRMIKDSVYYNADVGLMA